MKTNGTFHINIDFCAASPEHANAFAVAIADVHMQLVAAINAEHGANTIHIHGGELIQTAEGRELTPEEEAAAKEMGEADAALARLATAAGQVH